MRKMISDIFKRKSKWIFIKYKNNMAIYAVCQHCGFTYECSDIQTKPFKVTPKEPYPYCPNCGRKMGLFDNYKIYKYKEEDM